VFGRGEGKGEGRGPPRSGTTPTTYRYTEQRWEAGLGLYFYRARWYDPALGRFAQPDTVVPEPKNPQALNRYSYVGNNPLKYIDPTGLYSKEAVEAYMEYVYGPGWRERWDTLQRFYYALLAAEAGDFIFSVEEDTLHVYQILGTEEEIWGLREYEEGVGVDLGVEARERYTREDVNAWTTKGWIVGAYRIGGQAHISRLYGIEVHTVSVLESSIPAFLFALVPWPGSKVPLLKYVVFPLTRFIIGSSLRPLLWPDYAPGNDIIQFSTYGPEGYVGYIVIERGLIVNFVYQPYMVYYNLPPGP